VTVTLATGEALVAPYVLVALPLGVLKEGSVGFEPPLPAAKQAAVNNMVRGQALLLLPLWLGLAGEAGIMPGTTSC
jgi:monoamine oxidase